jgi:hypothetical protein
MTAARVRRLARRVLPRPLARRARHRLEWPRARREYLARHSASSLRTYRADIDAFWRPRYGEWISPTDHLRFTAVTGVHDVRFLPGWIWWTEVLPHFNDFAMAPAFDDKVLAGRLLPTAAVPSLVVKRVRGRYYDDRDRPLTRSEAWAHVARGTESSKLIAKPSATNNGRLIVGLESAGGDVLLEGRPVALEGLERRLGADYLVQERVAQHPIMGEAHPDSTNTLRVITFRWERQIRHLASYARFGTDRRITDNAGTGGVLAGVDGDGRLQRLAVDKGGTSHTHHPTTGLPFEGLEVPNFAAVPDFATGLHESILQMDLISWDIAIGEDGNPILLELNFRGAIALCQWALRRSIFGDLTADVIETVRRHRAELRSGRLEPVAGP